MIWPFKKQCDHIRTFTKFSDLHRGAENELYVRHSVKCRDCGHSSFHAVRLPDPVTEAIDANIWVGSFKKKEESNS